MNRYATFPDPLPVCVARVLARATSRRHDSLATICAKESERNAIRLARYGASVQLQDDETLRRQARGIEIKRQLAERPPVLAAPAGLALQLAALRRTVARFRIAAGSLADD